MLSENFRQEERSLATYGKHVAYIRNYKDTLNYLRCEGNFRSRIATRLMVLFRVLGLRRYWHINGKEK